VIAARAQPKRTLAALFAACYLARLPVTAISLAIVLAVRETGGAYALAGLAAGAFTLGLSLTAPLLARVADRRGAPVVIVVGSAVSGSALIALAAGLGSLPAAAVPALALVAGAAVPPLGAILRALLPILVPAGRLPRVYALEATGQELLFVIGPAALAAAVALGSARAAVTALGVLLVAGGFLFAAVARQRRRPHDAADASAASPLRAPALRAILAVAALFGMVFGTIEISTAAALERAGARDASGLVLAIWSAGSLTGGLTIARRTGREARLRLRSLLTASVVAALPLPLLVPWPAVLAAALFVHGLFIAPTFAATYELIPAAAPARLTEAFAWMSTAIVGGIALGSALAGSAVAGGGPAVGFGLALSAMVGARLVAGRGRHLLPRTRAVAAD
jgi:MFS family permease